uniref:SPX domain-containing protein n=1 Tax=Ditylum brightwellii TaxID=49249 RepID=A0A7S4RJ89_9STRA
MVEFGLKLEDNKVAEWSNEYIDYEKLKTVLKKAKAASKTADELLAKRPELVDDIRAEYEAEKEEEADGIDSIVSSSRMYPINETDHIKNLPPVDNGELATTEGRSHGQSNFEGGEQTHLLSTIKAPEIQSHFSTEGNYGSNDSKNSASTRSDRSTTAASDGGVMSFFGNNHSKKCKVAMKSVDDQVLEFSKLLYQELDKCNNFFDDKCASLERELDSVLDSAEHLDGFLSMRKPRRGTIKKFIQKRLSLIIPPKKYDTTDFNTNRLSLIIPFKKYDTTDSNTHGNQTPSERNRNFSFALHHDDEDEELGDVLAAAAAVGHDENEMVKVLRESDSIKRALKDLHRTAKLLGNFAIINFTGFVKITKKFQKTFPGRENQFSDITEDRICNKGKVPLDLAEKMEGYYAKWFCEGNLMHAQTQMLPKKGDGLSMDWSQLRCVPFPCAYLLTCINGRQVVMHHIKLFVYHAIVRLHLLHIPHSITFFSPYQLTKHVRELFDVQSRIQVGHVLYSLPLGLLGLYMGSR